MARAAVLGGVLVMAAFGGSAGAHPSRLESRPNFAVPARLPAATAGQPYTFLFCRPRPTTGACGIRNRANANPSGGDGAPYIFKLQAGSGFPPTGLALSNRTGILTGTVKLEDRAGLYPFTVCTWSNNGGTGTCRTTVLEVVAAPAPPPTFVGHWTGTYNASYTFTGCPVLQINGGASLGIVQNGSAFDVSANVSGSNIHVDTGPCSTGMAPTITSRADESFTVTLNAQTPTTLAGAGFVLTLSGANQIVGTLQTQGVSASFTFTRG